MCLVVAPEALEALCQHERREGEVAFDFLGLGALSLVRRAFDMIEVRTGVRPEMYKLPPNDPATYELIASGEMKAAGLKAIESAKKDGRWEAAYASQKNIVVPEDFQAALEKNTKAKAAFEKLKSAERYSFLFRIHHAKKPETRARHIERFVEMLEKGKQL